MEQYTLSLKLYWEQLGGHIHCRSFSGVSPANTHALNGQLVFDSREWPLVKERLATIYTLIEEQATQ